MFRQLVDHHNEDNTLDEVTEAGVEVGAEDREAGEEEVIRINLRRMSS